MGMTSHPVERVPLEDAKIAENYLAEDELQALNRKPMTTRDWIAKLDDFLKLSDREILNRAGRVSQSEAHNHARLEHEKFRERQIATPSVVEQYFAGSLKAVKNIKAVRSKGKKP